ncbi:MULTISPECIES: HPF/RaiA family ribosome-associated protein [Burkholderia]|uniref:HPF/RaiA family ribosome-associated protein n=1 Tax=Burkholderia TaxID=32008 RepID=UPI000F594637|nr:MULTISPECIES: HPF/RaiA family ribosome-associated protein [Burkholderia]RQR80025.1 ribosome-associated translation inhibitor RaiA [Burkholderia sp. Bp9012]RQZ69172.1 ribosome-associated translation inhibitor RaiA [Burkholderia sp. Bp9004]
MKPPYELVFQGMPRSDALEAEAARHVSKLDRFRQDISHCRVNVVLDEKRDHQGKPFNIRIEITIPGHQLVSSKEHDEDVYVALRNAFGNVTRMLEDTGRKQRGRGKRHDEHPAGPATQSEAHE